MRLMFAALLLLNSCAVSPASPGQAKNVGEAIQLTTIMEQGVDLYVTTGKPSPEIVGQLKILVPAVHRTLKVAEAKQAAGDSAAVAVSLKAFNEALAALDSYETLRGVKH